MCLIGKTQLLCMQCRGIGPHREARGKSHGFSRVAAGTWGIFSSCDGKGTKVLYIHVLHKNLFVILFTSSASSLTLVQ